MPEGQHGAGHCITEHDYHEYFVPNTRRIPVNITFLAKKFSLNITLCFGLERKRILLKI